MLPTLRLVLAICTSATAYGFSISSTHGRFGKAFRFAAPTRTFMKASDQLELDGDVGEWGDEEDGDESDWGDDAAASILSKLGFDVVSPSDQKELGVKLASNDIFDDNISGTSDDTGCEPPSITWGNALGDYLWEHEARVYNEENWPVLLFKGLLHREALSEAQACVSSLVSTGAAQSIEQNDGSTAIRRSRVVNLSPGGVPGRYYGSGSYEQPFKNDHERSSAENLRETILACLPAPLQAALEEGGSAHVFEDSSLVLYDKPADFYAEHHDSWWPGSPQHTVQRSFTILAYLLSPTDAAVDDLGTESRTAPASESGGTEFTNLKGADGQPLVLRPPAGDVIMWPNFDRDGNWSSLAYHRAVAVAKKHFKEGSSLPPKAVVNVWFEG